MVFVHKYEIGSRVIWYFAPNSGRAADSYSQAFISTSCVPPGPILGPLLFLIFKSDTVFCVENMKLLLLSDDIKLFRCAHCPLDCDIIQREVSNISELSKQNQFFLNLLKNKGDFTYDH